jgi:hypothetical protein
MSIVTVLQSLYDRLPASRSAQGTNVRERLARLVSDIPDKEKFPVSLLCYLYSTVLKEYESSHSTEEEQKEFENHVHDVVLASSRATGWGADLFQRAIGYKHTFLTGRYAQQWMDEVNICDFQYCCHVACDRKDVTKRTWDTFGYCKRHRHFALIRLLRKLGIQGVGLFDLYLNRVTFPTTAEKQTTYHKEYVCNNGNLTHYASNHALGIMDRTWARGLDISDCTTTPDNQEGGGLSGIRTTPVTREPSTGSDTDSMEDEMEIDTSVYTRSKPIRRHKIDHGRIDEEISVPECDYGIVDWAWALLEYEHIQFAVRTLQMHEYSSRRKQGQSIALRRCVPSEPALKSTFSKLVTLCIKVRFASLLSRYSNVYIYKQGPTLRAGHEGQQWFTKMQDFGDLWLTCVTQDSMCRVLSILSKQTRNFEESQTHDDRVHNLHSMLIAYKLTIEMPTGYVLQENLTLHNGIQWYKHLLRASEMGSEKWQREIAGQKKIARKQLTLKHHKSETVNDEINRQQKMTHTNYLVGAWMRRMMCREDIEYGNLQYSWRCDAKWRLGDVDQKWSEGRQATDWSRDINWFRTTLPKLLGIVEGFVNDRNNSVHTYVTPAVSGRIDMWMQTIGQGDWWKPTAGCADCWRLLKTHTSESLATILEETDPTSLLSHAWITNDDELTGDVRCPVCVCWCVFLVDLWTMMFTGFESTVTKLSAAHPLSPTDSVSLLQRAKLDFHYMLHEMPFFLTPSDVPDDKWYDEFRRIHAKALFRGVRR